MTLFPTRIGPRIIHEVPRLHPEFLGLDLSYTSRGYRLMGVIQELDTADVERVRNSFDRVWGVSDRTADLFYDRLFEIAPEVRPLFRRGMDEQKRKFMSTLAVIVGSSDDKTKLITLTETLARQHDSYGILPAHYVLVGDALLWSLERGLGGQGWTPDVAASWRKAYGIVSNFMIQRGARGGSTISAQAATLRDV